MSLRARRSRERRQWLGRLVLRLALFVLVLAGIAAIGVQAYRTGTSLALRETERLAGELVEVRDEAEALRVTNARLVQERDQALAGTEALQKRYDSDVPTGAPAQVLDEARTRLAAGIDAGLLSAAIRAAAPVVRCDGAPVVRRFRVTAGERPAAEDMATFLDGMIRVQATAPQGFEALARTMQVAFAGAGLEGDARATGVPATRVFRFGHYEVPVTVTASPIAGFAQATMATCRVE